MWLRKWSWRGPGDEIKYSEVYTNIILLLLDLCTHINTKIQRMGCTNSKVKVAPQKVTNGLVSGDEGIKRRDTRSKNSESIRCPKVMDAPVDDDPEIAAVLDMLSPPSPSTAI